MDAHHHHLAIQEQCLMKWYSKLWPWVFGKSTTTSSINDMPSPRQRLGPMHSLSIPHDLEPALMRLLCFLHDKPIWFIAGVVYGCWLWHRVSDRTNGFKWGFRGSCWKVIGLHRPWKHGRKENSNRQLVCSVQSELLWRGIVSYLMEVLASIDRRFMPH